MNKQFSLFCKELETDIKNSYESSPTIEEAEKLAAKFLHAQIQVGSEIRKVDLDARMKKTGVKSVKAAVYMQAATKTDKKPSDSFLEAIVNMDEIVIGEQRSLDEAEVTRNELENYLHVFKEAHLYYRAMAKGRFE